MAKHSLQKKPKPATPLPRKTHPESDKTITSKFEPGSLEQHDKVLGRIFLRQASKVWWAILASLPFDFALTGLPADSLQPVAHYLLGFGLTITLVCIVCTRRELYFSLISKVISVQKQGIALASKRPWLIVVLLSVVTLIEVVPKFVGGQNLLGILPLVVFGAIVLIVGARNAKKELKSAGEVRDRLKSDKFFYLERSYQTLFWVLIVPVVLARGVSLLAALSALGSENFLLSWGPYAAASLALIISLKPIKSDLQTHCNLCKKWTTRSLESESLCFHCEKDGGKYHLRATALPERFPGKSKTEQNTSRKKPLFRSAGLGSRTDPSEGGESKTEKGESTPHKTRLLEFLRQISTIKELIPGSSRKQENGRDSSNRR